MIKRTTLLVFIIVLSMFFISCDGWSLDEEEVDYMFGLFTESLINNEIDTFEYGESDSSNEYILRINFFNDTYSLTEKSLSDEIYLKDKMLYEKILISDDVPENATTFMELNYLSKVDDVKETLLEIFNDDDLEKYVTDIHGSGTPSHNWLNITLDNDTLINEGIIEVDHTASLQVYFDAANVLYSINFRIQNNTTNYLKLLNITADETFNFLIFPGNMDSYNTTQLN